MKLATKIKKEAATCPFFEHFHSAGKTSRKP